MPPVGWNITTTEQNDQSLNVPDFVAAEFHDLFVMDESTRSFLTIADDDTMTYQLNTFFNALIADDTGMALINDVAANMDFLSLDSMVFTASTSIGHSSYTTVGEPYNAGLINISMQSLLNDAPIGMDGEHSHYSVERLWMHEFIHASDPMLTIYNSYFDEGRFNEARFQEDFSMPLDQFYTEFLNTPLDELGGFCEKHPLLQSFYETDPERLADYQAHAVEGVAIITDYITQLQNLQENGEPLGERETHFLEGITNSPIVLYEYFMEQQTVLRTNDMMADIFGSEFERGNYAATCRTEMPLTEYLSFSDISAEDLGNMSASIRCQPIEETEERSR